MMSEKADQPSLSSHVSASTSGLPCSSDLEAADQNSRRGWSSPHTGVLVVRSS